MSMVILEINFFAENTVVLFAESLSATKRLSNGMIQVTRNNSVSQACYWYTHLEYVNPLQIHCKKWCSKETLTVVKSVLIIHY